ncbi:MAG TPA: endo-1,4-beta-xylanase [Opitutaceae bacterium]|nr:endo-1,4-beta-xylanase [Opitutaceae bacterium]
MKTPHRHPARLPRLLAAAAAAFVISSADAQLAQGKPKFLGNAMGNYVPPSFNTYWNQVTPGNSGKWGSVEGTRDVMNWVALDLAYNHAVASNFPFKEHTLVWGMQAPGWIAALPAAEQVAEVEEWFAAVAARYPALDQIDVVNEPLHVIPSYAAALGGSGATGWDWVIWSFQKARQHFPNSELLLNDYGILGSKRNTAEYIKIINLLKERGLIDAIGVQGHGLEYAQSSTIQANLNSLATTGLPIYVTELDLEHADDATQLSMYQRVFPLLYEHPGVVGVTLWGYLVGEHWKPDAYLLGRVTTLGSVTLTTSFQDYTFANVNAVKIRAALTNDDTDNARDIEIDYIVLNGVTHQAENQEINTGVWSGTCGGSFSQWLHCNGYIEFPGGAGTLTIRARGVLGTEVMQVAAVDDTSERPALQWLRSYFGMGGGGGGTTVQAESGTLGGTTTAATRAGYTGTGYVTGFDVYNDYVEVNVSLPASGSFPLVVRYAADSAIARTFRVNGSVVRKNFSLPASATFTEATFNANFVAGNNVIRIYVDRGASPGGDIDSIRVGN